MRALTRVCKVVQGVVRRRAASARERCSYEGQFLNGSARASRRLAPRVGEAEARLDDAVSASNPFGRRPSFSSSRFDGVLTKQMVAAASICCGGQGAGAQASFVASSVGAELRGASRGSLGSAIS